MNRVVESEILDHLPSSNPAAVRSRRDIRLTNDLMGNHRWIRQRMKALIKPGWRVVELGAGDGTIIQSLMDVGIRAPSQITAVDLAPGRDDLHNGVTWMRQDILDMTVLDMTELPPAEIVVANLFLHHLDSGQLAVLGSQLGSHTRAVLACEPARSSIHIAAGVVLATLADFDEVTNHDMVASIRAGFVRDELPQLLGLKGWNCSVCSTSRGAHHMEAVRLDSSE